MLLLYLLEMIHLRDWGMFNSCFFKPFLSAVSENIKCYLKTVFYLNLVFFVFFMFYKIKKKKGTQHVSLCFPCFFSLLLF